MENVDDSFILLEKIVRVVILEGVGIVGGVKVCGVLIFRLFGWWECYLVYSYF